MALTDHPRGASAALDVRRIAALAIGDAFVFVLFAAIGRASHSEAAGLDALVQVLETAAPFAAGWFVTAPFAGLYRADVATRAGASIGRSALAWLVGVPIGIALRMAIRRAGVPELSFFITSYIFVLVLMFAWRALFAWLAGRGRNV